MNTKQHLYYAAIGLALLPAPIRAQIVAPGTADTLTGTYEQPYSSLPTPPRKKDLPSFNDVDLVEPFNDPYSSALRSSRYRMRSQQTPPLSPDALKADGLMYLRVPVVQGLVSRLDPIDQVRLADQMVQEFQQLPNNRHRVRALANIHRTLVNWIEREESRRWWNPFGWGSRAEEPQLTLSGYVDDLFSLLNAWPSLGFPALLGALGVVIYLFIVVIEIIGFLFSTIRRWVKPKRVSEATPESVHEVEPSPATPPVSEAAKYEEPSKVVESDGSGASTYDQSPNTDSSLLFDYEFETTPDPDVLPTTIYGNDGLTASSQGTDGKTVLTRSYLRFPNLNGAEVDMLEKTPEDQIDTHGTNELLSSLGQRDEPLADKVTKWGDKDYAGLETALRSMNEYLLTREKAPVEEKPLILPTTGQEWGTLNSVQLETVIFAKIEVHPAYYQSFTNLDVILDRLVEPCCLDELRRTSLYESFYERFKKILDASQNVSAWKCNSQWDYKFHPKVVREIYTQ